MLSLAETQLLHGAGSGDALATTQGSSVQETVAEHRPRSCRKEGVPAGRVRKRAYAAKQRLSLKSRKCLWEGPRQPEHSGPCAHMRVYSHTKLGSPALVGQGHQSGWVSGKGPGR